MKPLVIIGIVLALLGLVAIAVPVFTTTETKDVAKLGGLQVKEKNQVRHVIPPLVGEGALALGLVMIVVGALTKR